MKPSKIYRVLLPLSCLLTTLVALPGYAQEQPESAPEPLTPAESVEIDTQYVPAIKACAANIKIKSEDDDVEIWSRCLQRLQSKSLADRDFDHAAKLADRRMMVGESNITDAWDDFSLEQAMAAFNKLANAYSDDCATFKTSLGKTMPTDAVIAQAVELYDRGRSLSWVAGALEMGADRKGEDGAHSAVKKVFDEVIGPARESVQGAVIRAIAVSSSASH